MSVSQPMSDSPPYNNVRLFARYGWMLIHQVGVWLSLVFLLADIATAVAKDSLSFLPDWLDSSPEFAPWVLWFGIVIGGFRILRVNGSTVLLNLPIFAVGWRHTNPRGPMSRSV